MRIDRLCYNHSVFDESSYILVKNSSRSLKACMHDQVVQGDPFFLMYGMEKLIHS